MSDNGVDDRLEFRSRCLGALAIAAAVIVFAVDSLLPLGVAGGVPYVVVVLIAMWLPGSRGTYAAAIGCTFLTVLGLALSPEGGVLWMVLTNRALAVFAIWATAILVLQRKRAEESRHELETQMLHTQKLESLGVMAGGIAHDFNNILMGVLGYADLALQDAPPGDLRDNLEQIERSANQAADLSRLMLAYSGRGTFVVEPLSLSSLVEDLGRLLLASMSKRAIVRFDLDENVPPIDADKSQIRQVVMNLMINASEALGEESGVIEIRSGVRVYEAEELRDDYTREILPAGRYVYVEVSDTGCGMDSEVKDKIFDPFFTTKFTGRGLGLAAALGIVHAHKGLVRVTSEVGEGSTFLVLIPASDEVIETPHPAPSARTDWSGSGKALVIDDEEVVRALLKRALADMGFTVLSATNGREALTLFAEQADAIDLVLLDLTMPELGGRETLHELYAVREDVRVILMSGYGEAEAMNGFDGRKPVGFLEKPYLKRDLVAKLREVLAPIYGAT